MKKSELNIETKQIIKAWIDNLDASQATMLHGFIANVLFGNKRTACEYTGIDGSIDTAFPYGITDSMVEKCQDITPNQHVYQYNKEAPYGQLRNPYALAFSELNASINEFTAIKIWEPEKQKENG